MPVYKNNTSTRILFTIGKFDHIIGAGKSLETEQVIPNYAALGLTLEGEQPFFNPCYNAREITSTGSSDPKTININVNTKVLSIYNPTTDITLTVFLRSTQNLPGLKVYSRNRKINRFR